MLKRFAFIFCLFLLILTGCGQNNPPTDLKAQNSQNLLNQEVSSSNVSVDNEENGLPAKIKATVRETAEAGVEAVEENIAKVTEKPTAGVPETFDNAMAFARQAPFGQWEVAFYQDGCEEASLIMVDKFFKGLPLDEKIMQTELDKVAPWELEKFGENLSVDTEAVAQMGREYFGLNIEVSKEVTVDKIKQEIAGGNLIILPLTGREIGNPNYSGEGPLYHMLVVKGYDRDQFITNDPGTRLGQDYKYKYDVLINATHDWNDGKIYEGERLMLIVKK